MKNRPMTRTILCTMAAIMLSACNSDVLLDEEPSTVDSPVAIGFGNGYVDNAVGTRAATYQLNDYAQTMGVWGWQKDRMEVETQIFRNHLIEYNSDKWIYAPLRYWETASHYRFYAYAPHYTNQKNGKATITLDQNTGMISISGVTLKGDNLQKASPAKELKKTFINATNDVDWMVARAGQTAVGETHSTVGFTMQHVLSKLNARIRLSEVLTTDADIKEIRINSMTVDKLAAEGSFIQKHTATQGVKGIEDEWTTGKAALTLNGAKDVAATTDWTYVLESLLIPQAMPAVSELTLVYSLAFSDGRTEYYTYRMALNEIFCNITHFISGNSYTVSITIAPDIIKFDTDVTNWTDI